MNPIALITGASAGIGRATALKLARNGYRVIATARRETELRELTLQIENETGKPALPLVFDVREKREVEAALKGLPEAWQPVDVLVNNAGLAAGLAPIQEGSLEDWEQMIDTNLKGLLFITRLITPGMVERKRGHIVNLGSIAGKEAYENGNVYNATKFAVDGLTRAMRIDLVEHGIKVTAIHPGAVETEFSLVRFKGDAQRAAGVYQGFTPLSADDVADAIWYAVSRPPHVNVNDMLLMPVAQASASKLVRLPTQLND
ncbi:MAG: SDR family NAD(P)-dependent oxidoreductase [Bacteroidales bacterium]